MIPLALAVAVTCAAAPASRTIASPGWTTVDVKPELANFYADHLAVALREDGYKVLTNSEISAIIGVERQAELLGCADAAKSCMAELANALGAELTLLGSIAKLEDTYRVHLKLLRTENGAVASEVEVEAKGEKAVLDALTRAGHKLTEQLNPPAPPPSLRSRSWIPFTGAGVLAAAGGLFLFLAFGAYEGLKGDLTGPMAASSQLVKDDVSFGKTSQATGWTLIGVGLAAAAAGVAMVVLGGPADPGAPVVMVTPAGSGLSVSGRFW